MELVSKFDTFVRSVTNKLLSHSTSETDSMQCPQTPYLSEALVKGLAVRDYPVLVEVLLLV